MSMDWIPTAERVAEVAYDTVDERRFRHPAAFRRWRPDRVPASCTFDQLLEGEGHADALLPQADPA